MRTTKREYAEVLISLDTLDLLVSAAVAHAASKSTRQLTFDRVHAEVGRLMRADNLAGLGIKNMVEIELFHLKREGGVDKARLDALSYTLEG